MAAGGLQGIDLDTEALDGFGPALIDWQIEQDVSLGHHVQPGVVAHFVLQLSGIPARIAQRHEKLLRPVPFSDGFENIARGRHRDARPDPHAGFPDRWPGMQHEAALGMHGTALVDQNIVEVSTAAFDADLVENVGQGDPGGSIDGDSERALVIVLTQQGNATGKVRVIHARHRDEELMFEIAHSGILSPGSWIQYSPDCDENCQVRVIVSTSTSRLISSGSGEKGADNRTIRTAASSRTS